MSVRIKNPIIIVGSGGGTGEIVELPILNALTISKSGNSITMTNPSTNGNFLQTYKFFANDEMKSEQTSSSYGLTLLPNGTYVVFAKAAAVRFKDSAKSNELNVGVYGILYDVDGLICSVSTTRITSGQTMSFTLTPKSGKYLPEFIDIEVNGVSVKFTYNSYSGAVSILTLETDYERIGGNEEKLFTPMPKLSDYTLEIDYIPHATEFDIYDGDALVANLAAEQRAYIITVKATALDNPKLRTPTIKLEDYILIINDLQNAETFDLIIDGDVVQVLQVTEEE